MDFYPIISIVFTILLFVLSGYYFHKGKYTTALGLIMIAGLFLRIFVGSDHYLHAWDERYHALVAKNMMEHPLVPTLYDHPYLNFDYTNWTANHIWVHKQPLPLWSMSLSMKVFGVNEFALRLPSILLSTLGIWLTFGIAKRFFGSRVGVLAAFLFAIHGLILEIGAGRVATDHTDLFFLVFVMLGVYFAIRYAESRKLIFTLLCGVAVACAVLSKWLPALIVLPVWLLVVYQNKPINYKRSIRDFIILLVVIFVLVAPWQWFIRTYFPIETVWENSFNMKHLTQVLDDQGGPFYYHFDKMRMVYGELVYIPFLWFIYITIKKRTNGYYWALLIWILVPYLFFSMAKTKMQGYTLFTAPALFIICALFWNYLRMNLKLFKQKWLIVTVLVLIIALPVRYSFERMKPFTKSTELNPVWAKELREFGEQTKGKGKVVLLNVSNPIEAMFYADIIAYPYYPTEDIVNKLLKKGCEVYINGNEFRDQFKNEHIHMVNLVQPK